MLLVDRNVILLTEIANRTLWCSTLFNRSQEGEKTVFFPYLDIYVYGNCQSLKKNNFPFKRGEKSKS